MLGRQPMDALADERVLSIYLACDAMDPTAATSLDDLLTETTPDELKLFKERVRGRGADEMKPADPRAGQLALNGLIDQVTVGLTAKLAAHQKRRELVQAAQLDLLAFDDSVEGEQARRYQLSKVREFNRLLGTYFKVRKETAADGPGGNASGGVEAAMSPEPTPLAGPVPVEPEVTAVGSVEPAGDGGDETVVGVEPCSASSIHPELMTDGPRAGETNPIPAVASADETNPIPAVARADETNPIPAVAAARETNPISAPGVTSARGTERTTPDVAAPERLLRDLRRRAVALSAAGYPVPIPR
jgi:hypothetical protein